MERTNIIKAVNSTENLNYITDRVWYTISVAITKAKTPECIQKTVLSKLVCLYIVRFIANEITVWVDIAILGKLSVEEVS